MFEDHTSGAIEVNAGSLTLHRSILRRNEAARGGALLVTGGDVRVDNTLFELNTATGGPESGGAIYVQDASTMVLGNETKIVGSKGKGGSVYSNVRWTYELPAPLAHYVQAQGGVAENDPGTLNYDYPIGCSATLYGDSLLSGQSNPGCTDSCPGARFSTPCPRRSPPALTLPLALIFTLTLAHPLAVAAGFFCPKATSKPIRCRAGTYCPRESAAETPCEAGTYNRQTAWVMFDGQQYQSGGTSEADCFDCPKVRPLPTQDTIKALSPQIYHVVLIENTPGQGHYCEEGSKGPKQCPRGTYGNEPNLGACADCEAGSFQGDLGQMACAPCLPGGYCEEGAAAPIPCMASTYSSATGLSSSKECETCPAGFFCEVGATQPTPCPAGKVGTELGRVAETFCITCKGDTTSLPGTTDCNFCNVDFYPSPQADPTVRHASNTQATIRTCITPDISCSTHLKILLVR